MTNAAQQTAPDSYHFISCQPVTGALGAEVSGVTLNGDVKPEVMAELNRALIEYKVLFFRDQPMSKDDHAAFASLVGTPVDADFLPTVDGYPQMTEQQFDDKSRMGSDINFHHDDSFHKYPSKMSVLHAQKVPEQGGDTVWVDMEKLYASLSPAMQEFLEGKACEHSLAKSFGKNMLEWVGGSRYDKMMERNPPHDHPLVIRHPETGEKCLYVSEMLSSRIKELSEEESDLLLKWLCWMPYRPEFSCRFSWQDNSVAWWDNRNTVHRGIDDFFPAFRAMRRIAIAAEQQPSLDPDKAPRREIAHLDIVACNSLDD